MARSVAEQLAFRTATPDDAPFAADVMTALFPRSPWDPVTLADDRDPDVVNKIWRLSEEAGDDVPTTMPRIPETMESYVRWTRAPEIHSDRFWIARVDDDVVGLSVLGYPPVRGVVGTEWTATARSVRGRGI